MTLICSLVIFETLIDTYFVAKPQIKVHFSIGHSGILNYLSLFAVLIEFAVKVSKVLLLFPFVFLRDRYKLFTSHASTGSQI